MILGKALGAIVSLILLVNGGFSPAFGQDVEGLIRAIDGQQQKIQTLVAIFSQKRETSLAKAPLLSSGALKFKRPDRIHFSYLKPEPMEIALDGKNFWLYYPGRMEAEKYNFSRNRKMSQHLEPVMGIFSKTFAHLAESYALSFQGKEMDRLYHFHLQPRQEKVQKFLSRVDLWIEKTSGAILRLEMIEASKDRLSLEFRDLQINSPLTDDDLDIKIPPHVKVREQISP